MKAKLPNFCFGCEPLGGTDWGDYFVSDVKKAISDALDLGVTFFDTADVYGLGLSETRLSQVLGSNRHDLIIATKGGIEWNSIPNARAKTRVNLSVDFLQKSLHESLKRLKVDRIPIYYIHWPLNNYDLTPVFEFLYQMREQCKIEKIGCSNFNISQLENVARVTNIDVIQIPINILNSPPDKRIIDFAKNKSIEVVAYNVLASGLLGGAYSVKSKFPKSDRRSRLDIFKEPSFSRMLQDVDLLKKRAGEHDISLPLYASQAVLNTDGVSSIIVGIKNSSQLECYTSIIRRDF